MQTIRTAVLTLAGLAAVVAAPGELRAQQYPWCSVVQMGSSASTNCGFTSYEQCVGTIRGQGGFCQPNGDYKAPQPSSERATKPRQR